MKRFLRIVGLIVLAVVLGVWAGGYVMLPKGQGAPRYTGTILSAEADRILRVSCFDCHSNEPHYVWYDYLPVALSLVAYDVIKGQKEVNFSLWDQYAQSRKDRKLKEMREQIQEDEMPPWYYTLLHREAPLSPRAKQVLLAALPAAGESGDEEQEHSKTRGRK